MNKHHMPRVPRQRQSPAAAARASTTPTVSSSRSLLLRAGVAIVLAATVAGCASSDLVVDPTTTKSSATSALHYPTPPDTTVEKAAGHPTPMPVNNYQGEGSLPPGGGDAASRVPAIIDRGRLIVGVDRNQNLLSAWNPATGRLEGFEVDLVNEIAKDIFGTAENTVEFRFVDSNDRLDPLKNRSVDMVVRTMSITEEREHTVAFSSPYFVTSTRVLTQYPDRFPDVESLAGKRICVTKGSSSLPLARAVAFNSDLVKTRSWADCLVTLQQNQAEAILTDETVLAGMVAQDPQTTIVGDPLATSSYAVAFPPPEADTATPGLIRQVNYTIERISRDGTWWALFRRWLAPYMTTTGPPPPHYRVETPAPE